MIINHNMASLNTYRQMSTNMANTSKSLEKLSSGLRINKAGDDAAGLAISEKMRGQIRGLDQAARNSQDGISMLQTAEGSLSETHAILQRMKELATQSANDTNVGSDRDEIQKEVNQLSSEINRIGNTTEFNTKSLLKGDGKANLNLTGKVADCTLVGGTTTDTAASQASTYGTLVTGDNGKSATFTLNGEQIKVSFVEDTVGVTATNAVVDTANSTGNSITIKFSGTVTSPNFGIALSSALTNSISKNDVLKNNFTATDSGAGVLTVAATGTGEFKGSTGSIAAVAYSAALATPATGGTASVGTTVNVQASKAIDFASVESVDAAASNVKLKALVGTGMTINDQQIEFYNSDDGAYTGTGIGVSISSALSNGTFTTKGDTLAATIASTISSKMTGVNITAATSVVTITDNTYLGIDGNSKIAIKDGGTQEEFKATFQVGANKGQSFTVDINDMRSAAIGITAKAGTAGFKAGNTVTDGTSEATKEASLDVSTNLSATAAIKVIDTAIQKVSAERSKLGAFTNRLDHTITNLGTSSENLTAAESRVRDVDMAKEMMSFQKNNILSQAAQAMMAQANQQPQGVLQLLR